MSERSATGSEAVQRALFEQAGRHVSRGEWVQACDAILRLRDATPDSVPIGLLATEMLLKVDRYREARAEIIRTVALPIADGQYVLPAFRWLRRFELPERMEVLAGGIDWKRIASMPMLAEIALQLAGGGLLELAEACLAHAQARSPGEPDLAYLAGLFHMFGGRKAASISALDMALAADSRMPNAHLLLAMQSPEGDHDARVAEIRTALVGVRPRSEQEAYLCYALHQRLHAAGRHREAWEALERGHAAQLTLSPYSREKEDRIFAALEATRPVLTAADDGTRPTMVFIVGMFRSGTSLVERVLGSHPDVADAGETQQLSAAMRLATNHATVDTIDEEMILRTPLADLASARRTLLDYATWRARGKSHLTEKLPANFLHVGSILQAFPEAKIIHMRRDPVDTCFSNLRTLFRGVAPYAASQVEVAHYYRGYARLMAHWHALAPGRILDVDYAAFVADPPGQARRILSYCGLRTSGYVMDVDREGGISATASAVTVRDGIHKDRGGAWKPYETALRPMLEILNGT